VSTAKEFTITAAANMQEIVADIAMALKLAEGADLRRAIRRFADASAERPILVGFPTGGGVELAPDGHIEARRGSELASAIRLDVLIQADAQIGQLIRQTEPLAVARAQQIVRPIFRPNYLPSRTEFARFRPWMPLIERSAYLFYTHATAELDTWRDAARREAGAQATGGTVLELYYALIHTMAHLMLAFSSAGTSSWLFDMAKSFEWINWTPTTVLFRERNVWLAAAAAKTAATFGPNVIDSYFRYLSSADHAIKIGDALFALVSIALTHEDAYQEIEQGIRSIDASFEHVLHGQDHSRSALSSALDTLAFGRSKAGTGAEALAALRWRAQSGRGLATPSAFRLDATDLAPSGQMLGFAVLAHVLRTAVDQHYPFASSSPSSLLPKRKELPMLFQRAWGSFQDRPLH